MSHHVYRVLLRLYTRSFRQRFEPEMLELFAARKAAVPRGLWPYVRFWRAVLQDLARSAFAEHFPSSAVSSQPGSGRMGTIGYDIRQAWRTVRRAPMLAIFVIALMALSIGTTTAMFSVVNAVLLRPFPFSRPDRLVMVWERRGADDPRNTVGAHEYPEWKARARSFAYMAAIVFDRDFNITGGGEPAALVGARVTSDFFPVLGVQPTIGRVFGPQEDQPGHGQVALISDRLWKQRFGADPTIAGRSIRLNDQPYVVLGVMPADLQFPPGPGGAAPDIWTPIAEPFHLYRGRHYMFVVARLNDGVTVPQAQAEMDAIAARLEAELPQFNRGHAANVQPLHSEIVFGVERALLILFAGVALVLLIGCCNVANLLLARAATRQQEIAVRVALGAGRLRIARQLLAEGTLLAIFGGAGGVLVAHWLIQFGLAVAPAEMPRIETANLDARVLAFAATVSLLTALVFGLVPLIQVARVDVAERLKSGSRGMPRPAKQRVRRILVIAEVALTMTIAAGAALFMQSFIRLLKVNPGFSADNILAVDVALPAARYRTAADQRTFFEDALVRLTAVPSVASVAATNLVPQGGGNSGIAIAIEGRPAPPPGQEPTASFRIITTDYFRTLGISVVSGRGFTEQDARVAVPLIRWFPTQRQPPRHDEPQAAPAAVINQTMAKRYWPGESALGKRFTVLFSAPITVVGVVKDTRNRSLAEEAAPEFYLSANQEPQSRMTLLVRASGHMTALPAAIRSRIWSIDRDLPASNTRTLDKVIDRNVSLYRSITLLLAGFGTMALVLMTLGVYAVVSYATAQRLHEIGVRLALGAQRFDIRRLIVGNGIALAATGIVLGAAGAYALGRYASSMLYEIAPGDPLTYGVLIALVLAIAAVASWVPAQRALGVDPVQVLRSE